MQGSFLTAGNTGADKPYLLIGKLPDAAFRILIIGVSAVDNDVARLKMRQQLRDHCIDRASGFDHQHDPARSLQVPAELLHRISGQDPFSFGAAVDESGGPVRGPVVYCDGESFGFHIENKIFPHHSESDHADIGFY